MTTTTARRITVKQQTAELIHATTRGQVFVVVVERGAWTIYAPSGERVGLAGWTDWDTARRDAQLRDNVRTYLEWEDAAPTAEEEAQLDARAAELLAEVRAEIEAEEAAAAAEEEAKLSAVARTAEANKITRTLGWTERHLAVVEHAAGPGIVDDESGYLMRPGGRRIATDVVDDLATAGFLDDVDGMVVASPDGLTAIRAVRASTLPFVTREEFAARRHDVNRSMAVASRRTLELLPPLPGGREQARRAEARRIRNEEYDRQAAVRRAEVERIRAAAEAQHQAEVEQRRAAEAAAEERAAQQDWYGCGQCPDTVELDARCGTCRSALRPAPHVVRAVVSRTSTAGGRGHARITLPARRAHRARDHRNVVEELAAVLGVQVSTPRRLLADGTHSGMELWRHVDLAGPARAVALLLANLDQVMAGLENLARRAVRQFNVWRRSLLTVLSGVLDDLTPAQVDLEARAFRSAVLRALAASMRTAPEAPEVDHRAPLWEQAAAVAAALWQERPVDPWAITVPCPQNPPTAAPAADIRSVAITQPVPVLALAA